MDIKDIRRKNFQYWADKVGRRVLAEKLGYKDTIYLNQLYGGHADIGNRTAKKVEEALGLASGWLSERHDGDPNLERIVTLMKLLPPEKQDEIIANAEFHAQRVLQQKLAGGADLPQEDKPKP